MRVLRSLDEAAASGALRGGAVAIGNMDGVHLGHRRLVEVAREIATRMRAEGQADEPAPERAGGSGGPSLIRPPRYGVLTFDPHPARVLRPELAPPLLTPLARKLELLSGLGLAAAVVQPFDKAYAATPAATFVSRDLAGRLGVRHVVVGQDFTAGRERARVDALRPLLAAHGISLHLVEPVTADGLVVSSTKIREFLLEGNAGAAAELLARPYDVDATVVRGAGRGRGFGFATANLSTTQLLPANGVYVVRAHLGDPAAAGEERTGVCNVGVKPTVEAASGVVAEVHLLDFDGRDLHGEAIRVAFLRRLRDERRFPSVEDLRAQIARDVEAARRS
jgi:riboflavin kinase/FMN adenylyltransferase